MKIRIIVVEDEPAIQQGLVALVRRLDLPVEVVGSFDNGESALRSLSATKPHIIITDIQMPAMSGLELISRIKSSGYQAEYLILSGYADFDYVREALKMSVHNYLLKPPKINELRESLLYLCQKTEQEQYSRTCRMLQDLIFQRAAIDTETINPNQTPALLILCCVGTCGHWNPSGNSLDFSRWNCQKLLEQLQAENVMRENLWVIDGHFPNMKQLVLLCDKTGDRLPTLTGALQRFAESFHLPATIVVSGEITDLRTLPGVSGRCLEFLKQNAQFGRSQVLFEHRTQNELQRSISLQTERALLGKVIQTENVDAVIQQFKLLSEKMAKNNVSLAEYVETARFILAEICRQVTGMANPELEISIQKKLDLIASRAASPDSFTSQVCDTIRELYKEYGRQDLSVTDVVELLWDTIHQDYRSEIDFEQFARHYGYHPGYLMAQFSKAKNIAPKKLIIKLRIEKAMELLRNDDIRMKDIAQMMGYNDVAYFSRAFKEYTGVSPSTFRENGGVL